jgi:MFS family permease
MWYVIRIVVAAILGLFYAGSSLCNYLIIYEWYRHRKRASLVPPVGPLAGMLAVVVAPGISIAWVWVPLVADGWVVAAVVGTIGHLLEQRRKRRAGDTSGESQDTLGEDDSL